VFHGKPPACELAVAPNWRVKLVLTSAITVSFYRDKFSNKTCFGPSLPEPASSFCWSTFTAIQRSESGVVFSFYLQFPEGMPIAPASARFNFRQEQTL
jgi:hypothetical protein